LLAIFLIVFNSGDVKPLAPATLSSIYFLTCSALPLVKLGNNFATTLPPIGNTKPTAPPIAAD